MRTRYSVRFRKPSFDRIIVGAWLTLALIIVWALTAPTLLPAILTGFLVPGGML